MIRDGHGCSCPIVALTQQRDVVTSSHHLKPEVLQRLQDILDGSVHGKLGYHTATPVSATNTSNAEDVSSSASGPKVSM